MACMACKSMPMPSGIAIAALLSLAAGMRPPVAPPVARVSPRVDDVAADTPRLSLSGGSGEGSSLIEAERPDVADNSAQDHGVSNNIKYPRQGPFNKGDRVIDFYCLMIQNALKRSLEERVNKSNIEASVNLAGLVTLGRLKLASTGNVSCLAVYRAGLPDKDPYVEIEFGTVGLDISSAPISTVTPAPSKQWINPMKGLAVDLGFSMDLAFALKINAVSHKVEITKSRVANFQTRSTSEESKVSRVTALCLRLGTRALETGTKLVADKLAPTCVTNGITNVFSNIGGYLLTTFVDPKTSCLVLKAATSPLAFTKLDFKSIDPVLVNGHLVKFRAEQVSVSPDFKCKSLSFNGRHLVVDLKNIEVDAQLLVDRVDKATSGDGKVMHETDLKSTINTKATVHFSQSIKVDLDILEPKELSIQPSDLALNIKVIQDEDKQGILSILSNLPSTVTKTLSASMVEQLGQVVYKLAAMVLEKMLRKELMKDMPLIEQHDGAAAALDVLTDGEAATQRSALKSLFWNAVKVANHVTWLTHPEVRMQYAYQDLP